MLRFIRKISQLIIAVGSAWLPAVTFGAHDSTLPALESFFVESSRFAERLSPDGKHVAYLGPDDRQINQLWCVGVERPDFPKQISPPDGPAVTVFFWLGNETLLWQSIGPDGLQRLFLSDSQGIATRQILADEPRVISLQGVAYSTEPRILMGLSVTATPFADLYRVKLTGSDKPELVCQNRAEILTWAWDQTGTPVAGLRWTADGAKEILSLRDGLANVVFRAEPADDARLLFATKDGSRVVILTDRDADLTHLERLELATGKREILATDPMGRVDVEQLVVDDRNGDILAAAYSDENIRWQSLDPGFGEMLKTLSRSPDFLNMNCLGVSADRKHVLFKRTADRDPGTVYLYDPKARNLRMLWRERPEMDGEMLCETKAFSYTARDGCHIPAYLTTPRDTKPPWPLIVFPHGGPRMRTHLGFDGRVQFLASRGYAVLQPNFRGSRGYGKAFMNAGDGQWGKGVMQTDVTDGVDFLVNSGKVDKSRIAIFGGSYGGYSALAGLAFTPKHYAAGICLFGISDLIDHTTVFSIDSQPYAGDTVRRIGDPATAAGRALLKDLSPINHAGSITAALLIYHGAMDTLIPVSHARRMVTSLENNGKPVDYLLSPNEAHGFSQPESEMAVYRAIEMFLHQHLGGKVGPAPAESVNRRLAEFRESGKSDARH
jgi:dipeptidyl aminopeptidase/acylaminoacyl peptidase